MNLIRIGSLIALFLRHFIASIISVAALILLVIVAYFILLIIAIVSNTGRGSPIALPLWMVAAGILSLFYTACLLFPSVIIAELIPQRLHSYRLLAEVLISTLILSFLVLALTYGIRQMPDYSSSPLMGLGRHPVKIFLALCLPLGLYFWTAKAVQAITMGIITLWKRFFQKERANSQSLIGRSI
jgi:hypothetical protein